MRRVPLETARHAAPSPAGPRDAGPPHAVALQRAIGNRATRRILARDPIPAGDPPQPPRESKPLDLSLMTAATRNVLRNHCRDRLLAALPFFIAAVKDNVAALKAEEKSKAEWAAALIDMVMGLGAPIFAKLLTNRGGITAKLAGKMSEITQVTKTVKHAEAAKEAAAAAAEFEQAQRALATAEAELEAAKAAKAASRGRRATKEADKTRRAAKDAAEAAAERAAELRQQASKAKDAYEKLKPVELIGDAEILKESMKALSRAAGTEIKQKVELLWGEDDVDAFVAGLEVEFHKALDVVTLQLDQDLANHPDAEGANFTDRELIGLWSSFDPDVTNVLSYRERIKEELDQFKTWVRPISAGRPTRASQNEFWHGTDTRAAWINARTGKELWLIEESWKAEPGGRQVTRRWIGRIPHEMERFAIAKTEAEFGSVETFDDYFVRIEKQGREAERREAEEKRRRYEILVEQHPEFAPR